MRPQDGQPWVSLAQPFEQEWRGRDAFSMVRALDGEMYRDVPGRRTLRFSAFGRSWFLKHHTGVGWKAVLGDWFRGRRPVTGADNEWHAIRALRAAGIDTMTAVAFGRRGGNPAGRESFLITADLEEQAGEPMVDLETLCAGWVQKPPPVAFKRALLRRLAQISRALHGVGITHRDYYLCHFLLPRSQLSEKDSRNLTPVLIDLHRALLQPPRLRRWVEKDLASLWFSARYAGLTSRDLLRFLRVYHDRPLRQLLRRQPHSWQRIEHRADAMLRREQIRQQRVRAQCLLPPPGSPVGQWWRGSAEQRDQIPRSLRTALGRCHDAGWLPVDRALSDVREVDARTVIELTGAGRLRDTLAPDKARQANLAAFLSWFPESLDTRPDTPPPAMLQAARHDRWRRISPNLYRDSIQVRRWSGGGRQAVYKRRLGGPDWNSFLRDPDAVMRGGHMLKDGDTTTVVQLTLAGQECVVKRYNLTGTMHALKRAPRASRAWRHWYHAHRLLTLGAWTPEPLLIMERRIGPLRRQAWLVTEAVPGRDLLRDFDTMQDLCARQRVLERFGEWFRFMRRHGVNHGDMKISNFIDHPAGLVVLDLDGMRWPATQSGFERGDLRDRRRFMRNWREQPDWHAEAQSMLADINVTDTLTD